MDPSSTFIDFYQILSILPTSSLPQIKSAYHRALLKHHPDKQINQFSSKPRNGNDLNDHDIHRASQTNACGNHSSHRHGAAWIDEASSNSERNVTAKDHSTVFNDNDTNYDKGGSRVPESSSRSSSVTEYTSISTIKQAYLTLSDPVLRAEYDATYNHARNLSSSSSSQSRTTTSLGGTGPRPAQLISLSDFTEVPLLVSRSPLTPGCSNEFRREVDRCSDSEDESSPSSFDFFEYTYPCRCGGIYRINEAQMERGDHLVGCESCSEVVWVGFEAATGDEDEDEEHELG